MKHSHKAGMFTEAAPSVKVRTGKKLAHQAKEQMRRKSVFAIALEEKE